MNYPENKTKWKIGDIVIHDADEKAGLYLMKVTDDNRPDGLIRTEYLNRKGLEPYYLNHNSRLHDPMLFEIDVLGGDAGTPQHYTGHITCIEELLTNRPRWCGNCAFFKSNKYVEPCDSCQGYEFLNWCAIGDHNE